MSLIFGRLLDTIDDFPSLRDRLECVWEAETCIPVDQWKSTRGTYAGAPALSRVGGGVRAWVMDGTDDYIDLGAASYLSGVQKYTLLWWAYRDVNTKGCLLERSRNATGDGQNMNNYVWHDQDDGAEAGKYRWYMAGGGSYGAVSITDTGTGWRCWGHRFDGSGSTITDKMRLFKNGVQQSVSTEGSGPTSTHTQTGYLRIGYDEYVPAYWPTTCSGIVIYSRLLTNSEIYILSNRLRRYAFPPAVKAVAAAAGVLEGSTTLAFSTTGATVGVGAVTGTSDLTFSTTGATVGTGALTGPTTLTFTTAADLTSGTELSGSTTLTFTTTGNLVGTGVLSGSTTLTFSTTGVSVGVGVLNASTTVDFSTSGLINGIAACVANTTLDFSTTGLLGGTGTLLGNSSISFTLTGDLALGLIGSTSLAFTLTGNVVGIGAISGTSSLTFGVSGGFSVDETGVLMDASPNIFWFGTIV